VTAVDGIVCDIRLVRVAHVGNMQIVHMLVGVLEIAALLVLCQITRALHSSLCREHWRVEIAVIAPAVHVWRGVAVHLTAIVVVVVVAVYAWIVVWIRMIDHES